MKQVRSTFIFLAFIGVAYAAYLVMSGQLDDFIRALIGVNPKWIIAGVACFLCYYVFGILAYAAIVVIDHDSPVGFRDLMSVEASGVFFMRLTPGGAGASRRKSTASRARDSPWPMLPPCNSYASPSMRRVRASSPPSCCSFAATTF